ncbi:MAG: alpha-amylase family glycosyl hydrolase [Desulfobulbaceae bacterium]|nr:alpha-amylase family glycosyl hydrolase [Desulfobulbaceae bacterium]
MIIYNLFPTLAGNFSQWQPHLKRAAAMGFNWVFVNPVLKPGVSGSLYSISDYFALNPALVSAKSKKTPEQQLKECIKAAAKKGLPMMIDLVISHCAADSPLIKEHPQWFAWEHGRVAHPFCNENGKKVVWKDLAQFDHHNSPDQEGLYRFILQAVNYLLDLGFKGFRCDAAYQVPGRLWRRLIAEVKKSHPEVLFFAETLGCSADQTRKTAGAGFDYIFNSSKWWDFHAPWLMEQYVVCREISRSVAFAESHDTMRLAEELHGNSEGLKQRYLFSALFSAGVMMPMGFEFGLRKKLHVVHTTPADWEEGEIDLTAFIAAVNAVKSRYQIFQEEALSKVIAYQNPNILILWKSSVASREEALLILNKDVHHHQYFQADNLQDFVQAGAPLIDISPEYALDFLPEPFSYDLRPGQGIVLLTSRDPLPED